MHWHRAVAALAAGLAWLACDGGAPGAGGPSAEGAASAELAAPDFTLPNLAGQQVRLADFRGKTVVIDFWATWCPPCIFQVPELNKFWDAHRSSGDVMVIGVAVDVEGASVVAPWVKEQDVRYEILIGSEAIAKEFGALGFPTLVVVTPDGRIDSLHVGLIEIAELEQILSTHRQAKS